MHKPAKRSASRPRKVKVGKNKPVGNGGRGSGDSQKIMQEMASGPCAKMIIGLLAGLKLEFSGKRS